MGGGYKSRPGDSMDPVVDAIKVVERRTSQNERPTGTSLSNLVAQVKAAIVGISAQVNAAISALVNITISGDLHSANVYATAAPAFNITGTRVAAWLESATGRLGMATSSRELKTNFEDFPLDKARLIMGVGIYWWDYIAEIRKRDDPTFEDYVGPDYKVGRNFGAMAEDLHAAGLWELVVYARNDVTETQEDENGNEVEVVVRQELALDAQGQPRPIAIHDALISYALIPVVADHESRLEAIEAILGIGSNS